MKREAIAVMTESMFNGFLIHEIEYDFDDYVIFSDYYGNKEGKVRKSKIRYDKEGNSYFISRKRKLYLDNFLKIQK